MNDTRTRHAGDEPREQRFITAPPGEYDMHPGRCCESCIQDIDAGYGGDLDDKCCCRAARERTSA